MADDPRPPLPSAPPRAYRRHPLVADPVLARAANAIRRSRGGEDLDVPIGPMPLDDADAYSTILGRFRGWNPATQQPIRDIQMNPAMLALMREAEIRDALAHELQHVRDFDAWGVDRWKREYEYDRGMPHDARPQEIRAQREADRYLAFEDDPTIQRAPSDPASTRTRRSMLDNWIGPLYDLLVGQGR
jgi:hypothetical protein